MTLKSNGSTFQRLVQPWENYVASTSYTVTFDAQSGFSSGAQGRVLIYDVDDLDYSRGLQLQQHIVADTHVHLHVTGDRDRRP